MRIFAFDAFRFCRRLLAEVNRDDLSGAAAELSYRLFLALFPFFIFVAALGGFVAKVFGVNDPTQSIMDLVGNNLPPDAASVLQTEVHNVITTRNVGLISIGIVGAVWAASSGAGTVMKAMNRAYEVRETRPLVLRWALAVGITLLGGGALIGGFVLMVVGQVYGLRIATELGIEGQAASLFAFARWPVSLAFVLLAVEFLYWAAPNLKLPYRLLSSGSLFFAAGWLLLTYLFGLYVSDLGSYDATYGTLGGVVVLMVWLYLTGLLLLIGSEINAVLARHLAPAAMAAAPSLEPTEPDSKAAEQSATVAASPAGRRSMPIVIGTLLALATWRPRRRARDKAA